MKKIIIGLSIMMSFHMHGQLLQKVYGQVESVPFEYNFYGNGLLRDIRDGNGTLIEEFIYDDQNNVISIISPSQTDTFTYDAGNHITSHNGSPIYYVAEENMYTSDPDVSDDNVLFWYSRMDANMLPAWQYYHYDDEGIYQITVESSSFTNGNLTYVYNGDMSERTYRYLNIPNPMRAACLSAIHALSLKHFGDFNKMLMLAEFTSENITSIQGYYLGEDPESYQHLFELTDDGHPRKRYDRSCYLFVPDGDYLQTFTYYYQGEEIP